MDTLAPAAAAPLTTGSPAGRVLDALARRDFADLAACFAPEVRMRAVLPRAVLDLDSAEAVVAKFADWFGGDDGLEVVETSVGVIGPREYLRWRIRMWPTDDPGASRIVEQHAFTRGADRIECLDLLCSGFQAESAGGAR